MKKESNVKYILRLALTLLVITSVVAVVLAGVNMITGPVIAAWNEAKTQAAIEAVLEGGYHTEITEFDTQGGMVTKVYQGDNGYAVQVESSGFDGTITMMVGISKDGKVLGISIINQSETAGLGAVSAENTSRGENFRNQYIGKSGELSVIKSGEPGENEVSAITGATITSKAVTAGVNAALECVAALG